MPISMKRIILLILVLSVINLGSIFSLPLKNIISYAGVQSTHQASDTIALLINLQNERNSLQIKLNEIEKENTLINNNFQALEVKNIALTAQFEDCTKKLEELQEKNNVSSKNTEQLTVTLEKVNAELMNKSMSIAQLNSEMEILQKQNVSLNNKVSELEAQTLQIAGEKEKDRAENVKLNEAYELLLKQNQSQAIEIKLNSEKMNELMNDISSHLVTINALNETIQKQTSELTQSTDSFTDCKKENEDILNSLSKRNSEFEELMKLTSQKNIENETLKTDQKNLLNEIELLKQSSAKDQQTIQLLTNKNKETAENLEESSLKNRELEFSIQLLQNEKEEYINQIEQLKETLNEYKENSKEMIIDGQ
jgi:chromosome segregation ATPase